MRDIDIRKALEAKITQQYGSEQGTRIVHELAVCCGAARIDIAVVNGSLCGFEIKSDADTLRRLPDQVSAYNKVFDFVTIVAGKSHIPKLRRLIPHWWGIVSVSSQTPAVFVRRRKARQNPGPDALERANLLWRAEALKLLQLSGNDRGYRSKSRREICGRLVEVLPCECLSDSVRRVLRAREEWRSAKGPFRCDGSRPEIARSANFQANRQWLLSL